MGECPGCECQEASCHYHYPSSSLSLSAGSTACCSPSSEVLLLDHLQQQHSSQRQQLSSSPLSLLTPLENDLLAQWVQERCNMNQSPEREEVIDHARMIIKQQRGMEHPGSPHPTPPPTRLLTSFVPLPQNSSPALCCCRSVYASMVRWIRQASPRAGPS